MDNGLRLRLRLGLGLEASLNLAPFGTGGLGTGIPSALLVIRSRRRSRQPVSAVASRVLIFVDNDCDNDGAASRPSRLSFGAASRSPPFRRQRLGLRWQAVFRATPLFPASPRILFAEYYLPVPCRPSVPDPSFSAFRFQFFFLPAPVLYALICTNFVIAQADGMCFTLTGRWRWRWILIREWCLFRIRTRSGY